MILPTCTENLRDLISANHYLYVYFNHGHYYINYYIPMISMYYMYMNATLWKKVYGYFNSRTRVIFPYRGMNYSCT